MSKEPEIEIIPPGPYIDPVDHTTTTITHHASGARTIVTTRPGVRIVHFEGPWHEDDILDLLEGYGFNATNGGS